MPLSEGLLLHPLGNSFKGGTTLLSSMLMILLLIMPAEESQLTTLKNILGTFSASTGLKVNFSKSNIIPINVELERMTLLADVLDCQVGNMPFLSV
jgi:hypothetical protein